MAHQKGAGPGALECAHAEHRRPSSNTGANGASDITEAAHA